MIRDNIKEQNPNCQDEDVLKFREFYESRHLMIITDN
jgi:hypothetical protein